MKLSHKKKQTNNYVYLLIAVLVIIAGFFFWKEDKPQSSRHTANSVNTDNTSQSIYGSSWQAHTNTTYGYHLSYPTDTEPVDLGNETFSYTVFINGCFKVGAGPEAEPIPESVGLSQAQITELTALPQGAVKMYAPEKEFKKLPSLPISHTDWLAFEVNDNQAHSGTNNVYITKKNGNLYIIDMTAGDSCDPTQPLQILSSFAFTK